MISSKQVSLRQNATFLAKLSVSAEISLRLETVLYCFPDKMVKIFGVLWRVIQIIISIEIIRFITQLGSHFNSILRYAWMTPLGAKPRIL